MDNYLLQLPDEILLKIANYLSLWHDAANLVLLFPHLLEEVFDIRDAKIKEAFESKKLAPICFNIFDTMLDAFLIGNFAQGMTNYVMLYYFEQDNNIPIGLPPRVADMMAILLASTDPYAVIARRFIYRKPLIHMRNILHGTTIRSWRSLLPMTSHFGTAAARHLYMLAVCNLGGAGFSQSYQFKKDLRYLTEDIKKLTYREVTRIIVFSPSAYREQIDNIYKDRIIKTDDSREEPITYKEAWYFGSAVCAKMASLTVKGLLTYDGFHKCLAAKGNIEALIDYYKIAIDHDEHAEHFLECLYLYKRDDVITEIKRIYKRLPISKKCRVIWQSGFVANANDMELVMVGFEYASFHDIQAIFFTNLVTAKVMNNPPLIEKLAKLVTRQQAIHCQRALYNYLSIVNIQLPYQLRTSQIENVEKGQDNTLHILQTAAHPDSNDSSIIDMGIFIWGGGHPLTSFESSPLTP